VVWAVFWAMAFINVSVRALFADFRFAIWTLVPFLCAPFTVCYFLARYVAASLEFLGRPTAPTLITTKVFKIVAKGGLAFLQEWNNDIVGGRSLDAWDPWPRRCTLPSLHFLLSKAGSLRS
jgi:hypothetical protein